MGNVHKGLVFVTSVFLLAACGQQQGVETLSGAAKTLDDFGLISRDLFFGNPTRIQGRISPDGTMMSFLAPLEGVQNVWVAPLGDFAAARAVTDDTARGINSHSWAFNGENLLYLRDQGGNEDFHIYSIDLETGQTIDLTPFENTRGQFIQGSYRHPDEFLLGINDRDPKWHDVWRVNVKTGERALVELHDRFGFFIADLDMNVRLAGEPTADGGQLIYKQDASGEWVEFFTIAKEDDLTSAPLVFTEDGTQFYMIDSSGRDKAALVLVDYDTDDRTIVAEHPDADVSDVIFDPVTNEAVAYSANFMREEWYPISEDAQEDIAALASGLAGDFTILGHTRNDRQWIVASDAPTAPLTYYNFDRDSDTINKLFETRPGLAGQPLNEMHPLVIKSRDNLDLVSYLTLPPHADTDGNGRPDEPMPMVLDVHGGPWSRDSYGYSSWAQWLSNRGYAVMNVNYRGSTGLGKSFLNAGDKQWAAAMHDDLIDAVDWAVAEGIAQPQKIAIAGGSYGGYATLVGLTYTPERFACGADIVGPSNLVTLLNSIPEYWAAYLESFALRVGDPRTEEGQRFLRSRSPLFLADKISKPLLIGQGANDPRVKQAEADQIVSAMQTNELPVTYVLYPDEGHGFARPENRESFYSIMETFLATCLGGRSQPIGSALAGSSTQVPVGAEFVPGLVEALAEHEPVVKN